MYPNIQASLKAGNAMYIFRSGGGLRVVRVEQGKKRGELLGYGEYCNVGPALEIADLDLVKKKHKKYTTEYLTGSMSCTSKLDEWICCGHETNFKFENNRFYFFAELSVDVRSPEWINEKVLKDGKAIDWELRGIKYRTEKSMFPSGEPCLQSTCLTYPTGSNGHAWFYKKNVEFYAYTFEKLLDILENELDKCGKTE